MRLIFFTSVFLVLALGNAQQKKTQSEDLQLGERDPFAPPKYITEMEQVSPYDIIDKNMEAIRRWPISEYKLKGIIWDVKNPKAMIVDKVNTLHLLKKKYRIGNREGLISEINESEIVIIEKGVPTVLQIDRSGSNNTMSVAPGAPATPDAPAALKDPMKPPFVVGLPKDMKPAASPQAPAAALQQSLQQHQDQLNSISELPPESLGPSPSPQAPSGTATDGAK